ncbi:MAG: hypothetical protein DKT66_23335 [Candidatus Melainabacteria bacterium]|nr:MAG: hypothetical protein DKT66_23335 [Candidatus Melainabacteria bacterium]
MTRFAVFFVVLVVNLAASAQAQGLIGVAPEHVNPRVYEAQQRKHAKSLELQRVKIMQKSLADLKSRQECGSVIWELALTYENLCRWQDALSAYNTLEVAPVLRASFVRS